MYAVPKDASPLLANIRKVLGGLGWGVFNSYYRDVMAMNARAEESSEALRDFIDGHGHRSTILGHYNQLVQILNDEIGIDEGLPGYHPIVHFQVIPVSYSGQAIPPRKHEGPLNVDQTSTKVNLAASTAQMHTLVVSNQAQMQYQRVTETLSDIDNSDTDFDSNFDLQDQQSPIILPPVDQGGNTLESVSDWDFAQYAKENGTMYVHSDGRVENGLYPPEYYKYQDDIAEGTWDEGLQAIEDFNWD